MENLRKCFLSSNKYFSDSIGSKDIRLRVIDAAGLNSELILEETERITFKRNIKFRIF